MCELGEEHGVERYAEKLYNNAQLYVLKVKLSSIKLKELSCGE